MSVFTGKSDFHDWVFMHSKPEEFLKEGEVWIGTFGGADIKVDTKDEKDLFLLGTHIVSRMEIVKGKQIVVLCGTSYIDSEEKETVALYLKYAGRCLRKLKREKADNVPEKLFKYLKNWFPYEADTTFEKFVKECFVTENGVHKIKKIFTEIPTYIFESKRFLQQYLIPGQFFWVRTQTATRKREQFVQTAKEKYNLESSIDYYTPGDILQEMYLKIDNFYRQDEDGEY